ncbi:cob(I)yrinic acid a,c-diamide adenosyltransferase [Desulfofustis glycolicus]|uniref:corrinoid adenosyltransferase n=1 Tax=Desulfofustis glycolicus DSM 9705 TaxID=1121409 RepID=A0A1M5VLZ5_9BACT|nr:cob(I)yrinic acid a,c-diamide adenosyltransferase [Desulfofustis glycolicus]SHH76074.1 cob(I)alamin adenosyltransferase [Desulfofustis glycolicus DSM 9705]
MLQVYTGNGKGKTTAAFGLALRAAGAGQEVFFAQFVKGKSYSEIRAVERWLPTITVKQYGRGCFIVKTPEQEDFVAARHGLADVADILRSGSYGLVVLDEACIATHFRLFSVDELLSALRARHHRTEAVVTGRYAPPELIAAADLVTEMREIKHYYNEGHAAREGVEF